MAFSQSGNDTIASDMQIKVGPILIIVCLPSRMRIWCSMGKVLMNLLTRIPFIQQEKSTILDKEVSVH